MNTGPTDLGGSDSPSQQEDRAINAIPALRTEIRALSQRFDEHAQRTQENFRVVFGKQDKTNGRLGVIEIWKAELRGAKTAVSWLPPLATSLIASAFSVALYALFLAH